MIRSFSIVAALAFCLLSGCGSPDMAASEANSSDTKAALEDTNESLLGSWVSPSCGERTYPRRIQFDAGSRFRAQDLVSPCPPDVACFWSGIIYTNGRYMVEEDTITLIRLDSNTGPIVDAFPKKLLIDPVTEAPVEIASDGRRCLYKRTLGDDAVSDWADGDWDSDL